MRRRSLGRTVARTAVVAGTATAVSGHVARRQGERYDQQTTAQAVPPESPRGGAEHVADELRKLASLRDDGIPTDGEFAAQKARLLGL